jgi:hypothetical protein
MRTYEELPTIIGEMKRAAIDCWMADDDYCVHFSYDDTYALWGYVAANSYARPGADGQGGGEFTGWVSWNHPSLAPRFDEIRGYVDGWTAQWKGLPDGSACTAPLQATTTTAAVFGASGSSPSVQDNGEISTANHTVADVLVNNIKGSFVVPFHDKYYTQFSMVEYGLGAATAILQVNYNVENTMWEKVRDDVTNLCVNATNAWKKQADLDADAYGTVTLTVVGAVVGALATIATAGAMAPAVAALVTISTVATAGVAGIAASASISGGSYLEIFQSLADGLTMLGDGIRKQEQAVMDMLDKSNTFILDNKASFDLDAFSLGHYPGSDGTISMQQSNADLISTNMKRIISALDGAKTTLGAPPATSPTPRDGRVGVGAEGPHPSASALYTTVATCLQHTTSEYTLGHDLFDATVADYFQTDADATKKVNQLAASEALTTTW